jgi:hypothetical protein
MTSCNKRLVSYPLAVNLVGVCVGKSKKGAVCPLSFSFAFIKFYSFSRSTKYHQNRNILSCLYLPCSSNLRPESSQEPQRYIMQIRRCSEQRANIKETPDSASQYLRKSIDTRTDRLVLRQLAGQARTATSLGMGSPRVTSASPVKYGGVYTVRTYNISPSSLSS